MYSTKIFKFLQAKNHLFQKNKTRNFLSLNFSNSLPRRRNAPAQSCPALVHCLAPCPLIHKHNCSHTHKRASRFAVATNPTFFSVVVCRHYTHHSFAASFSSSRHSYATNFYFLFLQKTCFFLLFNQNWHFYSLSSNFAKMGSFKNTVCFCLLTTVKLPNTRRKVVAKVRTTRKFLAPHTRTLG